MLKKRTLALLLSLTMLLSLLTPTALAEEPEQEAQGTGEVIEQPTEGEQTDLNGESENQDGNVDAKDEQDPGDEEQSQDETKGEDEQPGEETGDPDQPSEEPGETETPDEPEQGEETETPEEPEQTECTCGAEGGEHAENCPLYEAAEETVAGLETLAEEDGLRFYVEGTFPAGAELVVTKLSDMALNYIRDNVLALEGPNDGGAWAYDIKIMLDGEEYQPEEAVTVQVTGLGVPEDGTVTVYHLTGSDAQQMEDAALRMETANLARKTLRAALRGAAETQTADELDSEAPVSGETEETWPVETIEDVEVQEDSVRFTAESFSVWYWEATDYQEITDPIIMNVGELRTFYAPDGCTTYNWSFVRDNNATDMTNYLAPKAYGVKGNRNYVTVQALQVGTYDLVYTEQPSRWQTIKHTVRITVRSETADPKIQFVNVYADPPKAATDANGGWGGIYMSYTYSAGNIQMKIRFEDETGALLTEGDNPYFGEAYYDFDSDTVAIDMRTFADSAPEGYSYAGAFFYWLSHVKPDGTLGSYMDDSFARVFVTSVERRNTTGGYNSYLWYTGTRYNAESADPVEQKSWDYNPTGVMHVVYLKNDKSVRLTLMDHDGKTLNELAGLVKDHGDGYSYKDLPQGWIDNLTPPHANGDDGYTFTGWKIISGVGAGDTIYTMAELQAYLSNTSRFKLTENTVIQAVCTQNKVTLNYVAVGPAEDTGDFGSVTPTSEELDAITGEAEGSTATPGTGYKFVGWFTDAACTIPADATWVNGTKLTPAKAEDELWVDGTTYYAKFDYDLTSLTITKKGCKDIDENQSFVFTVTGGDLGTDGIQVTIQGNDSVTITGLKVGTEYTVTEKTDWSWRYTPMKDNAEEKTQQITLQAEVNGVMNEVTFTNDRTNGQWLNGCSWAVNNWNNTEATKSPATPGKTN